MGKIETSEAKERREAAKRRDREAIRTACLGVMRDFGASPATRTKAAALLLEVMKDDDD